MSAAEAPAPAPAAAVKAKTVDEEKNVNALWRESIDKKTGRTYYVNKLTKKVQWKRPDGYTIDSEVS
jgi:hypothetical protein